MLRNIPVELSGHKVRITEAPSVKTREKDGQQEVVTDFKTKAPKYVVGVFVKPRRDDEGRAGKGVEVRVTLDTDPGDQVDEGDLIELIAPTVSHWEMTDDHGRTTSGLSWRALGIKPAIAVKSAA
jgi:hypothetical protein